MIMRQSEMDKGNIYINIDILLLNFMFEHESRENIKTVTKWIFIPLTLSFLITVDECRSFSISICSNETPQHFNCIIMLDWSQSTSIFRSFVISKFYDSSSSLKFIKIDRV
jgi:hypothetical protein